jgi:hypothetical protein
VPAKPNSRWLSKGPKPVPRFDSKRTVEQTRHVRRPDGTIRRETDAPTEVKFCERSHAGPSWRNGARIRKS